MPFQPGFVTASDAQAANAAMAQSARDRQRLDALTDPPAGDFPAKLTSFDSTTQTFAWQEQWYDANGQRVDRPGGRFGSASWDPAKPVGNGLLPPPALPVEVRLTPTVATADRGLVYEFPWSCNCAGQGSGTGSGGTSGVGVLTACCANAIPATLTLTLSQTAGAACALGGQTVTLTHSGGTWSGSAAVGGTTWDFALTCDVATWSLTMSGDPAPDCATSSFLTIASCNPLHLTGSVVTNAACSNCNDAVYDVDVTE